MREYLKDTILEHPLITIVVSGVVLYALFSYGVIYYENKNDEFIEEHHSRIWNRHSFFSELNFLEHNLFIKEKICNYFDSKSSIPFPSGCWKDKKKFLELKNELYKVYDLQRISYNSQRIAEVENILEKQSTIDLDKLVFYMRNKEDYVEIDKNKIKIDNYFYLKGGDRWFITKVNYQLIQNLGKKYKLEELPTIGPHVEKKRIKNQEIKHKFRKEYQPLRKRLRKERQYEYRSKLNGGLGRAENVIRDSFSKRERDKYEFYCDKGKIFSLEFVPSYRLCYQQVHYVDLGGGEIQILKLKNVPFEDNVFPNSIYEEKLDSKPKLGNLEELKELQRLGKLSEGSVADALLKEIKIKEDDL